RGIQSSIRSRHDFRTGDTRSHGVDPDESSTAGPVGFRFKTGTRVDGKTENGIFQAEGMGLMFCRYCGAHILEDSLFCAKCGKNLGRSTHPRIEKLVHVLRLNTPYPYFGILLIL